MRCWNPHCRKLISIPEIIDGKAGEPGQIRRAELGATLMEVKPPLPGWEMAGVTAQFMCSHCGTEYMQTTRVMIKRDNLRQQDGEGRGDGWD